MQAAESKHPFYVAYNMPGLRAGVSGDAAGKLYFVQAEQPQNAQTGVRAAIQRGPLSAFSKARRRSSPQRIRYLPSMRRLAFLDNEARDQVLSAGPQQEHQDPTATRPKIA
jgi:hypothetical protein